MGGALFAGFPDIGISGPDGGRAGGMRGPDAGRSCGLAGGAKGEPPGEGEKLKGGG